MAVTGNEKNMYASLYKSYGNAVDSIRADDVTVSLVRKANPTQIVVTKELSRTEHIWPGSLSDKLEKHDLRELLKEAERLQGKTDREFAKSVLEVGIEANKQIFKGLPYISYRKLTPSKIKRILRYKRGCGNMNIGYIFKKGSA